MKINKLYIIDFNLNKKFIRQINITYLKDTLDLLSKKEGKNEKLDLEIKNFTSNLDEKIENFKNKQDNYQIYEDIESNLRESERLLNEGSNLMQLSKEKIGEFTINILNNQLKGDRNDMKIIENVKVFKEDIKILSSNVLNNNNLIDKTVTDIQSNKWINWLEPIVDFMKSNSSLILTISSGLIIGGMWYVNSRGIDIGAMLGRLGLNIYSNLSGSSVSHSNISNTNLELPLSAATSHNHQVAVTAHGFFRQLGTKILEILDIYIEKMKDKRQKY